MGIHYFYGKYVANQGRGVNIRSLPVGIEGIIFDLNGLLHKIAQQTFFYGDYAVGGKRASVSSAEAKLAAEKRTWKESVDAFLQNLTREMNHVLDELHPQQYLIIAVDGVAPIGKTTQQRSRRFRDLIPSSAALTASPTNNFTSALIAPGTTFMRQIDDAIQLWISRSSRIANALPPITIYSGWWEPGEGEHKAFAFLRELFNKRLLKPSRGAHVVYGMDSDLMMLCLLSPVRNMYLCREDLSQNVNIDSLFNNIARDMRGGRSIEWANVSDREEAALLKREFVVMAMLLGNDFVPVQSVISGGLPLEMMVAYQALTATGKRLTKLNSHREPELDLTGVMIYAAAFSRNETAMLTEEAFAENRDRGTKAARISRNTVLQTALEFGEGRVVSLSKFKQGWYEQLREYRSMALKLGRSRVSVNTNASEFVQEVIIDYLSGIEWTLRYYTLGGDGINWMFRYAFIGAPLMSDVARFLHATLPNFKITGISQRDGPVLGRGKSAIGPIHQLLAINPAAKISAVLGNEPILSGLLTEGELAFLSPPPETIQLFSNGIHAEYQTIPILPEVNFVDLIDFLEKYDLSKRENTISEYLDPDAITLRKLAQDEEGFVVDEKTGRRYQPKLFPRVTALIPRILTLEGSRRQPVILGAAALRGRGVEEPEDLILTATAKIESYLIKENFGLHIAIQELKDLYPEEIESSATAAWFRGSAAGVIIIRGGEYLAQKELRVVDLRLSLEGVETLELVGEVREFKPRIGIVRELESPAVLMIWSGGKTVKSTAENSGELLFVSEIREGDLFVLSGDSSSTSHSALPSTSHSASPKTRLRWSITTRPQIILPKSERADEVENNLRMGESITFPDFVGLKKWWPTYLKENGLRR